MSDSILYLAIVAIWAGFLIPAWVRRPHSAKTELDAESDAEADAESAEFDAEDTVRRQANDVAVEVDADVQIEVSGDNSEYRYDVHMHSYGPARPRSGAGAPAAGPSPSRQKMMRARRRILTILTALVFITASFVAGGFVKWWICVPPIAMLVLYVLLLREIVLAEAELARKRAAWEARAARDIWRRAHQAWQAEAEAAAEAEPTAEIIDISGRVGDQLYDQYADAAVRAVGD